MIDATLIRGVLLPATMKLLGEANWYLPRRLSWLPKFAHEPADRPEPLEHLGERLSLPPAFEHLREQVEPPLTPLPNPRERPD